MAYPNTIKYYINSMTPSPSVESRSTAGESELIEPPSCHTVDHLSHKPHTAHLKGTKRPADVQTHGIVKHFKPSPKVTQHSSTGLRERVVVSSDRTDDAVLEASDEHSVAFENSTSTPNHDPLHDAIARILPSTQPGLFPQEICDQLYAEYQDLIWEKYRSFDSFKTMIHQTLTLMLKRKKLERQSAKTQKGGRSHQYIRVGQLRSDGLQSRIGGEFESSDVDVADSYSIVFTISPDAESHAYNPVPSDIVVPALPALAHLEKGSHTEMSIARTAASAREETLPRPAERDPEPSPKMSETRTSASGQESAQVTSNTPKNGAQDIVLEKGERAQPRAYTIPSPRRGHSLPHPVEVQDLRPSTDTSEHNSGRQGLASRADVHDHQMVTALSPRTIRKAQGQSSDDAEGEKPAVPSLPLQSGGPDAATKLVASDSPSTGILSSLPDKAPPVKTSAGRPSTPSSKEAHRSVQGKTSHERTSISDTLSGLCDENITSHPSGSSSGTVSLGDRTANRVSYVKTAMTAPVAHKPITRGYPAQGQKHATATGANENPTRFSDVSACSKRIASPKSQSQPFFTAINPKKQPEVACPMPSAGAQMPEISTSKMVHGPVSRSTLAQSSNLEAPVSNTSKNPCPQARPEAMGPARSCVLTPKQQSSSSSIPAQQRAVEYPKVKGPLTIVASKQQLKQGLGVTASEPHHRNSSGAKLVVQGSVRSVGEVQQTVTVDPTSAFAKPADISPNITRMQTNHGDHSALELGNLVTQAREKRKQRQKHADDARSFDLKRQQAELHLDRLIEEMNDHMEKLCGLHRDLEKLHDQVAGLENKVQAIRQQADQTRDTAHRVTLECQAHAESRKKAEKEFTNSDKELKQLVQILDIL